jgi:hypothetical protein
MSASAGCGHDLLGKLRISLRASRRRQALPWRVGGEEGRVPAISGFLVVGQTVGFSVHPKEKPMNRWSAVVDCTTGRSAGLVPLSMLPV